LKALYQIEEITMLRRILVATDGSEGSRKAVELAATLASQSAAEVVVVHVLLAGELARDMERLVAVEPPNPKIRANPVGAARTAMAAEVLHPLDVYARRAASSEIVGTLGDKIIEHAEKVLSAGGVKRVKARILDGNPVEQILHAVDEVRPDLVICGARGLSKFQTLLLGSVSNKIAQLCPVTCITVR
jgi:nucleotide-binding universal stress UspA family protein